MQLFYGRFSSKKTEKCSIQIKIVNLWLLWNSSFRIEAQIHETRLTNPIWNVALILCEKGKGNRSRMSTVQLRHFPITCTRAIRQIQSHNWLHNSVSGTNWKDQIRHWNLVDIFRAIFIATQLYELKPWDCRFRVCEKIADSK